MRLAAIATELADLLLPGGCGGCGRAGPGWCDACEGRRGGAYRVALPGGPQVLVAGRYRGPLRGALLAYKERGRRDLCAPLADLLADAFLRDVAAAPPAGDGFAGRERAVVWFVPAPSRRSAARARGGDHVLRLCRALAAPVAAAGREVAVAPALVLASRARDSVGLDAAQRAANLAGRLRIVPAGLPPPGTDVVLVDDVVTSGATLRAARAALLDVGVRTGSALVLCDATTGR